VVRGSVANVLSMLVHHIDPALRKMAKLGDWQIISQNEVEGLVTVAELHSVQSENYKRPTVILTEKIMGEEEIPEGVVAVISPDRVDVLSHVSIRARNANILFATCYEHKIFDELKSTKGKSIHLAITSSGDVNFSIVKGKAVQKSANLEMKMPKVEPRPVVFSKYAISAKDFTDKVVGAKSHQLSQLQGKLPDWIHLPRSVAIPFCVCEKIQEKEQNRKLQKQYSSLEKQVDNNPEKIRDPWIRAGPYGWQLCQSTIEKPMKFHMGYSQHV